MADYLNIAGRIRTTASDGVAMEAQEVKDLNLNKSQQEVNADVQTELGDRYTKEETYNREELNELITTPDVNRVYVIATNLTTSVTDLLPATGSSDTLYNVGNWNGTQYDTTVYSIYGWDGTAYVCLAVRSSIGEVYDISANHPDGQGNPTPYADLTAALGTDGANVPAGIRRGGMSIKFIQGSVQSSDNKYYQFQLTSQTFSIEPSDWLCVQKVVDDITVEKPSKNLFISQWSESGYAIDLDNGEEKTATNYRRTGFINVLPETEYTASCVLQDAPNVYVFCYDENKSYIDYVTAVYGFYPHSFTTLAGTYYIRIEHTSGAKPINYQIEVGNVATEYVPPVIRYKVPLTSIEGIGKMQDEISKNKEKIDAITILKIGKNRFDSEWSEAGKKISFDTGQDQDGTTQRRTGYVAVDSQTTYTLSCVLSDAPSVSVFYYGENQQYLSGEETSYGFYPKTITTPADCKFIRIMHGSGGMPTNYQVEEGSKATSYEPYQPDSYKVPVSAIDGLPDEGINNNKWLFLGDSITAMSGNTSWVNKFKELVYANEQSFNQAVGGAKWCDDESGIVYNGKPYESQNYIGNQVAWVQRTDIINVDLDAIIISAGTNDDNVTFPSDSDIESAFYASGSSTLIALENVDRSTWQGAIRWTVQTLRGLFPNAKIFLATPLQRMSVDQGQSRGDMYPVIRQKRETIIKMAKRMSVYLIDTSECNISDMQSGMYADGLHLSVAGSTVMSKFVYNSIKNWF